MYLGTKGLNLHYNLSFFSFFVQILSSVAVRNVFVDTTAIFKPDIIQYSMCVYVHVCVWEFATLWI